MADDLWVPFVALILLLIGGFVGYYIGHDIAVNEVRAEWCQSVGGQVESGLCVNGDRVMRLWDGGSDG